MYAWDSGTENGMRNKFDPHKLQGEDGNYLNVQVKVVFGIQFSAQNIIRPCDKIVIVKQMQEEKSCLKLPT